MKIKSASKNSTYRTFYKDAYLRSGRSIWFNAWNENGDSIYENQLITAEIPNIGIYYYDFTTPNIDSYVLIIATDNQDPQGTVLKIGNPIERTFYLRGDLAEGVTTTFEIYDQSSNILATGVMESIVSGFYTTVVDGLSKPWFLQINELVDVG